MFIREYYIICQNFMYMVAHFDRFGKLCTLIFETNQTFLVDKSPLEIISDNIRCAGYNLKGAMETARIMLGNNMCPILVNPINRIILFPTKSAKNFDTIWFNPEHIKRTTNDFGNTKIIFSNGRSQTFPVKLSPFNHRLQIAEQYKNMTFEITRADPYIFILDAKKRPVKARKK